MRLRRRKDTDTAEYRLLVAAISAALFECDPGNVNFGENTDEYERDAARIAPRLRGTRDAKDVLRIVEDVIDFGGEPPDP